MTAITPSGSEAFRLNAQSIAAIFALIVVLSVAVTAATVFVVRHLNSPEFSSSSAKPGEQSLQALNYVRSHVEDHWYVNGQMPQYLPLTQIGIDPNFMLDLPALRYVRLGGHPVDKQSTYIQAVIGNNVTDGTAGHSVYMTIDSMPAATTRGRQTYYRCYVRGPNGQVPMADMKRFPGICRNDNPMGGMGVEGQTGPRSLEWPILK